MTRRNWLVVLADRPAQLKAVDWFSALSPLPYELEQGDHLALVYWPMNGTPSLAATVALSKVSQDTHTLRLRHRVAVVDGHPVTVASLGARLAIARGWTGDRREELIGGLRMITSNDFELIEQALLAVALRHGPSARRPAHRTPRTPGRRALIAGRAANPRGPWHEFARTSRVPHLAPRQGR